MALCVSIGSWLLLDQSNVFSINQKSYREFFKTFVSHVFFTIQTFSKVLSLYSISLRVKARFLSFLTKFLQRFLSSYTSKTFIPLHFHLFSLFVHFFMHLRVIFEPKENLGFLMILIFSLEIDQWVFVVGCYTTVLCVLILSIWWFVKNENF